jgi:hypothetical protein
MKIDAFLDWLGEFISARWQEFKLVFSEPVLEWPLWAGIVAILGLFVFWSMAIRMARDEILAPNPEQIGQKSRWGGPKLMILAAVICAAAAISIFISSYLPQFFGVCFTFLAWLFYRCIGIEREWSRLRQHRQKDDG